MRVRRNRTRENLPFPGLAAAKEERREGTPRAVGYRTTPVVNSHPIHQVPPDPAPPPPAYHGVLGSLDHPSIITGRQLIKILNQRVRRRRRLRRRRRRRRFVPPHDDTAKVSLPPPPNNLVPGYCSALGGYTRACDVVPVYAGEFFFFVLLFSPFAT